MNIYISQSSLLTTKKTTIMKNKQKLELTGLQELSYEELLKVEGGSRIFKPQTTILGSSVMTFENLWK
jgi:hypothetical protein